MGTFLYRVFAALGATLFCLLIAANIYLLWVSLAYQRSYSALALEVDELRGLDLRTASEFKDYRKQVSEILENLVSRFGTNTSTLEVTNQIVKECIPLSCRQSVFREVSALSCPIDPNINNTR